MSGLNLSQSQETAVKRLAGVAFVVVFTACGGTFSINAAYVVGNNRESVLVLHVI